MPSPHYLRVREFMRRVGQDTPPSPVTPDAPTRMLRAKLILEEALETVAALGVEVTVSAGEANVPLGAGSSSLSFETTAEADLEGVVDGCADISVVTIGTLIAFGVDDEPVLEEVDAANLRKFGPGSRMRDDGKWIKPPDWTPPDILGVVDRLGTPQEASSSS